MMQVVPCWHVQVWFASDRREIWIHDSSAANVLRQVASIQFTANSLDRPTRILIECDDPISTQVTLTTSFTQPLGDQG